MESHDIESQQFKSENSDHSNLKQFDVSNYLKHQKNNSPGPTPSTKLGGFEQNETDSLNINNFEKAIIQNDVSDFTEIDPKIVFANDTSNQKMSDLNRDSSEKTFDLDIKSAYSLCDGLVINQKSGINNDICNINMSTLNQDMQFSTPNKYNFDCRMKLNGQAMTDNKHNLANLQNEKTINITDTPQPNQSIVQSTTKSDVCPNNDNSEQSEDQVKCTLFNAKSKDAFPPIKHMYEKHVLDCCNCKKSKCLKLYCECFRNGKYCIKDCLCIECRNLKEYENLRLKAVIKISARNPMAFKPKIDKVSNIVDAEGSNNDEQKIIHTRGCNCKKSKCLLKYCECFQNGVPCTDFCKCCNCHNTKDGHNCHKAKEVVVRETVYGSKKNKKSKIYDKNKSHLSKRDEIDFGYEAIDIKSDLKYAKIGTSAYTECQDAIFQSESEESNKNVLRTSKYQNQPCDFKFNAKKSIDKYKQEDHSNLFFKNQIDTTKYFAEFGTDENYFNSTNEISKLINKNRDVLLS